MSFNHTISAILRGHWMIERSWAEAHLPLVLNILNGNPVERIIPKDSVERKGNGVFEQPFVIDPATMTRYDAYKFDWNQYKYVPNPNIPENSVAIVSVAGPITKYDGSCGEPGAIQRNTWLHDFEGRKNISSVIMLIDTPGGEARAANSIVSTIKNYKKPILSYVDGMSASLGMWLTAASNEVYLSSKMDQVGSIGSYVMLADFRGALEKEGIKLHEIYAPQSTDKNKDYRDALAGNYDAIKEDLKVHVDEFISFVKTNRPQSAEHQKEWGTGKMFYASEAKKLGLVDGVLSFAQVVSRAAWLSKRQK